MKTSLLIILALFSVAVGAEVPLKVFDFEGETYACYANGKAASVRYDAVQDLAVALIELTLFGTSSVPTQPWDACDTARCYATTEAEVVKACPKKWVVAENPLPLVETQPLYACNATCAKTRVKGAKLGRTLPELVTPCEGPLVPAWIKTGTTQWQYTKNGALRGIAPCVEAP